MSLNSRSVCNTFLMYVLRFLLNCVASYWALSSLKSEIKGTIICLQMLQWHLQEFKCHQSQDILPPMHSSFLLTPFRGIPFLGCWLSVESECGILKTTSWWLVWASRSTVFGWRLLRWCWWENFFPRAVDAVENDSSESTRFRRRLELGRWEEVQRGQEFREVDHTGPQHKEKIQRGIFVMSWGWDQGSKSRDHQCFIWWILTPEAITSLNSLPLNLEGREKEGLELKESRQEVCCWEEGEAQKKARPSIQRKSIFNCMDPRG